MTTEIRNTSVSLAGLLDVLGENLYSTPIVCIRELIQNAHDACIRRKIEAKWDGRPSIQVETNLAKATIRFTDNGSGLTDQEIISYLATIGDGYTRKLRNAEHSEEAIGYFGLGFLSTFVIAEKVEFITTSYQDPSKGWRYVSKGGQKYTLEAIPATEIGSTVILHLKEDYTSFSETELVSNIVKKYCCLLPLDIFVNDDEEAINQIDVPWRLPDDTPAVRRQKSSLRFAEIFDQSFDPIVTFPIIGTKDCPVNGLLWIQDGAYYASSDNRSTTIFIRSMHLTDECKDLLPAWAGFIGCVIDTPMLTPTASRESVQLNTNFDTLREHVKATLVAALANIAKQKDANWRRTMSRHSASLLGAAVSDPILFDAMNQQLTVPTSEGDLMASEIIKRSGVNKIRLSLDINTGYETLISNALGIPIVHGYRYGVATFCRQLETVMNVEVITIGSSEANTELFPEHAVDELTKTELLKYFGNDNTKTIISSFEPNCLPLILAKDQDAMLKKRIESDKMDQQVGAAALMMARQFTGSMEIECEYYLFLNYDNDLIRDFCDYGPQQKQSASQVLLKIGELLSGDESLENIAIFDTLNANLATLITGNA